MSDDISIPQADGIDPRQGFARSYRARHAGVDQGTKRLLLLAGALGFLLVAGMGTWALTGRRPAGTPVIEADTRPVRVKPDNPGGLQVFGANEEVMGGGGGDSGPGTMAPAPEVPAPQALRAQVQTPARAAQPAQSAQGAAAPSTAAPSSAPAPVAPQAPAAASAPASAPPRANTGGTLVQLAAVEAEPVAQTEWQRLVRKMPDLLRDRRLVVQRIEKDGHAFWRVRTGGFADVAEATGFCAKVKAKGGACTLATH